MKQINNNTKRAQNFVRSYFASNNYSLKDCYGKYSQEKQFAESYCKSLMLNEGGRLYRIISYNTFSFTAAWMIGKHLRVETPKNSYIIENFHIK